MEIYVQQIKKSYGSKVILNDITFSAGEGDVIGITGRNGCGKSTLLSILAGVNMPDSGNIAFSIPGGRRLVGYLPQTNPLIESATVADNLKLWTESVESFDALADTYHFREILNRKVKHLSGGMKRRLAIACALALQPKLLIMDEPTSALDLEYKKQIHQEMMQFVNQGGIIIMVSHETDELNMCTCCYQLVNGNLILFEGNTK